jgi:hypothetical protein
MPVFWAFWGIGEIRSEVNKSWLIKRIAWRLQALAEGDLSERARQRAKELANDADLRLSPPKSGHLCLLPSASSTYIQCDHANERDNGPATAGLLTAN